MRHPAISALALHAGGDLGPLAAWRLRRHLARCKRCRAGVAKFAAVRAVMPELAALPGLPWNRLAAEMKANIHLGLAAGECVSGYGAGERVRPFLATARAGLALASAAVLVVVGMYLQRPAPPAGLARGEGIELRSTANGIQVQEGGAALRILHDGTDERDVFYVPGAQGAMRASYVDSETEYVTVASVYAY